MTDTCLKCDKDIPNVQIWYDFTCPHCGANHTWDEQPEYDEDGSVVDITPFTRLEDSGATSRNETAVKFF